MDENDFDDLIAEGLRAGVPQRLLLVLLNAEIENGDGPEESSGTLTPVMVNDVELAAEVTLEALLEEADSVGQPWNMVMVSTLAGEGGAMPDSDEAKPHLEKMAGDVLQGRDLAGYAIFDREGTRLAVSPGPSD